MVPISDLEKDYVLDRGWEAFERELVEKDPDLLDPRRPPIC